MQTHRAPWWLSCLPKIVAKASAPTSPLISHAVSRLPEILAKVSAPTPRPISHAGEGFARDCAKRGKEENIGFQIIGRKLILQLLKHPHPI